MVRYMDYEKFNKEYDEYKRYNQKFITPLPIVYTSVQEDIEIVCNSIKDLLISKNKKYGNSALEPKRIFSRSDAMEQIKVRIDDKLSRIATSGTEGADEDTLQDLIGYLVLLKVAMRQSATAEEE